MKKFFLASFIVLALATTTRGQYIWKSTDTYQIWERLDSICPTSAMAFYTHYPWKNTDLYQIWLKLDSCFSSGGGGGSDSLAWHITGNSGTVAGTNFIGTVDSVDWLIKTHNIERGRIKSSAGQLWLQSGYDTLTYTGNNTAPPPIVTNNIFIGDSTAYRQTMTTNDTLTAQNCIAIGRNAMRDNKYLHNAIAIGTASQMLDTGRFDYSCGAGCQFSENVSVGNFSLMTGQSGVNQFVENVAMGYAAGQYCNSSRNVYIGTAAGQFDSVPNTSGNNTYVGAFAGQNCNGGSHNSFYGYNAGGGAGVDAVGSTFIGYFAGYNTGITFGNVYVGQNAGANCVNDNHQVAVGEQAGQGATAGHNTVCIGAGAGTLGSFQNTIYIAPFIYDDATQQANHSPIHFYNLSKTDSSVQTLDLNGNVSMLSLVDQRKTINTTASDTATINSFAGRFRKDTSGTTFTLTNALVTANSIVMITLASDPGNATTHNFHVVAGSGSFVVTFENAPNNDTDINFVIIN